MLINLNNRVQLKLESLQIIVRRSLMSIVPVLIADPALPLHVIYLFFQGGYANAKAVQFVGKFSG